MRRSGIVLALCLLSACGSHDNKPAAAADTTKLTQRQRDSVIGASRLPGARGIQKAQRAQDSEAARTARLDSIR